MNALPPEIHALHTVIGPFEASDVCLDASPSVSGLPALTGVMGTVEAIRRAVSIRPSAGRQSRRSG